VALCWPACRDAGRVYGTPKKNRSGRRGQMVKVILQRAGAKVIEVRFPGGAHGIAAAASSFTCTNFSQASAQRAL
jgi:NifU-like protein involved in Fe-S cluster formation